MKKVQNFNIEVANGKVGHGMSFSDIGYNVSKFNAGEINVQLEDHHYTNSFITISITGNITSSDDIMELLLLNDAIERKYVYERKILNMFYAPYSRQDRVCNDGEALSIKVFANLINSCNFDTVYTKNNHSDVSTALINNCIDLELHNIVPKNLVLDYDFFISPDAGANKKTFKLSQKYNIPMIQADKTRDTKTGDITGTIVHSDWQSIGTSRVLIVDDICDGGRTFLELAKALKELEVEHVDLYITHGIFANGLEAMKEAGIEKFFTSNNLFGCDGVKIV